MVKTFTLTSTSFEVKIGIAAACLPTLRPGYKRVRSYLSRSQRGSDDQPLKEMSRSKSSKNVSVPVNAYVVDTGRSRLIDPQSGRQDPQGSGILKTTYFDVSRHSTDAFAGGLNADGKPILLRCNQDLFPKMTRAAEYRFHCNSTRYEEFGMNRFADFLPHKKSANSTHPLFSQHLQNRVSRNLVLMAGRYLVVLCLLIESRAD